MEPLGRWTLLRIFIGDSARKGGRPLSELIVERAKAEGMAGTTVLRGIAGFGSHSKIHTARLLDLSSDLPIVIEVVDTDERVRGFLPALRELVEEGMITLEKVEALALRPTRP